MSHSSRSLSHHRSPRLAAAAAAAAQQLPQLGVRLPAEAAVELDELTTSLAASLAAASPAAPRR
jgi:hypothetical protein